jgi:hypothetical protein
MEKPKTLSLFLGLLALGFAGCGQAASDNDAIRGAINDHLAARGNLNIAAFDTEVQKLSIQGDQAQADVVFRVKGGPGMMQLSYNLQKSGAQWAVVESSPVGSNFTHPALDANGMPVPGSPGQGQSGPAPDIFDAIHQRMGNAPAGNAQTLPPGHPQVNSTSQPKQQ